MRIGIINLASSNNVYEYEALNILNKTQFRDKFFSQPFQESLPPECIAYLSMGGKINRATAKSFTGITPAAGTFNKNVQRYHPPSKNPSTPPSPVIIKVNQ